MKTRLVCLECGRRFSKEVGRYTIEVKCPKCGSYDTEVAGYDEDDINWKAKHPRGDFSVY